MEKRSDISGFHGLSVEKRLDFVREFAGLSDEECDIVKKTGALDIDTANRMIENVVGTSHLPLGIATNFRINGRDYLIPMAIDEPSVVAAASYAAKLARPKGGFTTSSDESVMIGQIQLLNIKDFDAAKRNILEKKDEITAIANEKDPVLLKYGGGVKDIEIRIIDSERGKMLIVHLLVNVSDAMGANAVNTMAEWISPRLEELSGGDARLRIISNLATKRLARARAVWDKEELAKSVKGMEIKGEKVVDYILDAYHFALVDQYRCATHNKGVMNGIDAVVIATGNDFRAVEAGAHSYAARDGRYTSLTKYEKDSDGNLVGEIELPVAVGTVGGAININPVAKIALKILGVKTARELSEVIASVGLAQNFAALRALATEGIQSGHMKLHAKNIAAIAGAKGSLIDEVANRLVKEKNIKVDRAKEILKELG